MNNHHIHAAETTANTFHPTSAEELVVRCRDILSLQPDSSSGDSAVRVLQALREILDLPEAIEIYENVTARRSGGYRGSASRGQFVG